MSREAASQADARWKSGGVENATTESGPGGRDGRLPEDVGGDLTGKSEPAGEIGAQLGNEAGPKAPDTDPLRGLSPSEVSDPPQEIDPTQQEFTFGEAMESAKAAAR
jgi:hypothetical protein